jgi:hypothetical protein
VAALAMSEHDPTPKEKVRQALAGPPIRARICLGPSGTAVTLGSGTFLASFPLTTTLDESILMTPVNRTGGSHPNWRIHLK